MSLPKEAENTEGVLTDNGTIVYKNEERSATIGVQTLSEELNGTTFESVRTTINIKNATASKMYDFDFNLAKDANGDEIETYYKTSGSTLTQVVNFDEDTAAFPVVADPIA